MGTRLSSKSQGLSWYQIWSTSHMKFIILFLCASPPYPRWWIANSLFLTLTCLEHYSWLSYQAFLSWLSSQINLCLLNLLLMFYYQTHFDCQLPPIYSSSLIHICNSLATFLLFCSNPTPLASTTGKESTSSAYLNIILSSIPDSLQPLLQERLIWY